VAKIWELEALGMSANCTSQEEDSGEVVALHTQVIHKCQLSEHPSSPAEDEHDIWYYNLGANVHITCQQEYLTNYQPVTSYFIQVSSGHLQAVSLSDIRATTNILGRRVRVELKNVLLVPGFGMNLVLNHQVLYGHGHEQLAVFENGGATVYDKATGKVLIQATDTGVGIPVVELEVEANEVEAEACVYMTVMEVPSLQQLHCHFNHLNECKLCAIACQLNIPVLQGARLTSVSCVKK
jgi:hypothetical protein